MNTQIRNLMKINKNTLSQTGVNKLVVLDVYTETKFLDVHTQCQEPFQLLFFLFVMTSTTKRMRSECRWQKKNWGIC